MPAGRYSFSIWLREMKTRGIPVGGEEPRRSAKRMGLAIRTPPVFPHLCLLQPLHSHPKHRALRVQLNGLAEVLIRCVVVAARFQGHGQGMMDVGTAWGQV